MRIYGTNWGVMRLSRSGLKISPDAKGLAKSLLEHEKLSTALPPEYGWLKRIEVENKGGSPISEKRLARIISFGLENLISGSIHRDSFSTIHVGPFRTVKLELKSVGVQNTLSITFLGYSLPIAQLSKAQRIIDRQSEELSGLKNRFSDLQTVLEQKEKQGVPRAKLVRFLGEIQHDINNYLTGISGYAQLLKSKVGTGQNESSLEWILYGSKIIGGYLNKIIKCLKDNAFTFEEEADYLILKGIANKIDEEIKKGEDIANYQVWIANSQPKRINIKRILVLDDQEEKRKFALEKFDFVENKMAFETLAELLAYLNNDEIFEAVRNGEALISIDYNMPEINGIEAVKRIKEFLQDKGLPEAPLPLILNSNRGSDIEKSAQEAGFHGRIDKNGAKEEYMEYLESLQKAWNGEDSK